MQQEKDKINIEIFDLENEDNKEQEVENIKRTKYKKIFAWLIVIIAGFYVFIDINYISIIALIVASINFIRQYFLKNNYKLKLFFYAFLWIFIISILLLYL